ncbi:substrate-binding domain-containing protein [Cellulomonas sp. JZ18]|uniref:LacI family DNA-binding transcriptional regulator n=1 Tax=Cellulomonas sp. JZ18 TaxID=2654191 RepID=UPI0012D482D6|nr:LacI family DNA-binding transcriptional regulator [Cellulomonas sp. JZ18]QGQ18231.1 substrate-binding domain-containing protein [Cellulomonas sp. JZ18]
MSVGSGADRAGRYVGVREVAARAGVSLGTVSNVLNNPDRVTAETRERVEQAMRALGFVPSRAAGQLRSRRSELIGVVVPDVGNPFWAAVLRGVESVTDRAGLTMVVGSTHQDPRRQRRLLRGLESQGVDGLVIAPIADRPSQWAAFEDRRFGVVTLDRRTPRPGGAWVSLDNVLGAGLAMGHLADAGYRRIALVNGPVSVSWCAERREGAEAALVRRGLDPAEVLVEVEVTDLTVEEGGAAVAPLLDAHRVDAVMCVNDMLALGVLLATQERGLRVPQDVALVGYDDADFAPALNPPLTTVRQPSFAMGVAAAELLLREGDHGGEDRVEFQPQLVVRASTGTPATARP